MNIIHSKEDEEFIKSTFYENVFSTQPLQQDMMALLVQAIYVYAFNGLDHEFYDLINNAPTEEQITEWLLNKSPEIKYLNIFNGIGNSLERMSYAAAIQEEMLSREKSDFIFDKFVGEIRNEIMKTPPMSDHKHTPSNNEQVNNQRKKAAMKYTRDDVRNMTFEQFLETICDELNDNGFEYYVGWEGEVKEPCMFSPPQGIEFPGLVEIFFSQIPKDGIDFLKEIGLLNNGRCTFCDTHIDSGEYVKSKENGTFHICRRCSLGLGPSARMSEKTAAQRNPSARRDLIDRANRKGCLIAVLLFPLYAIKTVIFG